MWCLLLGVERCCVGGWDERASGWLFDGSRPRWFSGWCCRAWSVGSCSGVVQEPFRTIRNAQTIPDNDQHRRVERLVTKIHPARSLPRQVPAKSIDRLTIRQTLKRLQHHHRRDHPSRDHRPTKPRPRVQVGEVLVPEQGCGERFLISAGENSVAVLGERSR